MANFIITVLLGWCGIHKFLQKKAGMGVVSAAHVGGQAAYDGGA